MKVNRQIAAGIVGAVGLYGGTKANRSLHESESKGKRTGAVLAGQFLPYIAFFKCYSQGGIRSAILGHRFGLVTAAGFGGALGAGLGYASSELELPDTAFAGAATVALGTTLLSARSLGRVVDGIVAPRSMTELAGPIEQAARRFAAEPNPRHLAPSLRRAMDSMVGQQLHSGSAEQRAMVKTIDQLLQDNLQRVGFVRHGGYRRFPEMSELGQITTTMRLFDLVGPPGDDAARRVSSRPLKW